jgi:hypothetical protein
MKGPYKPVVYTDFSGGLATTVVDNLIKDNQSPDILNVIFDGKGSIQPRLGNKLLGSIATDIGEVRNTWATTDIMGSQKPLRILNTSASAWVEYYNTDTAAWETLDAGYTKDYDFGHAQYDDYTYFSSIKDYQRRWNGITGKLSAAVAIGHTSCALSAISVSSAGFLSAGSLVIDGEEIYYTSAAANIFHTAAFTAIHAISVTSRAIAQLPTSAGEVPASDGGWDTCASALPHGFVMIEKDAQMFVAGSSSVSSNVVWYSYIDDPTNYRISSVAGGGGSARYPETQGGITALADFDTVLAVLKENTIRQLKFDQIGTDAGVTEIVSRDNIITGSRVGAINNKCLATSENDIVFVSPNGEVKKLTNTSQGRKTEVISDDISVTMAELNLLSAAGVYFDGKYYLACAESDSDVNNIVMVWDSKYKAWTKFNDWDVNDWFIADNRLYYGASNEIATYQALYGYDDNSNAYEARWGSRWMDFGVPSEQKRLRQIYMEGYITSNTTLNVSCYFDGNINSPVKKSIAGTGDYIFSTDSITTLGENVYGTGIFSKGKGGANSYTLRKFRVNLQFGSKAFYNMQIKVGTAAIGSVWKVTHIAPYLIALPGKRTPTDQQI